MGIEQYLMALSPAQFLVACGIITVALFIGAFAVSNLLGMVFAPVGRAITGLVLCIPLACLFWYVSVGSIKQTAWAMGIVLLGFYGRMFWEFCLNSREDMRRSDERLAFLSNQTRGSDHQSPGGLLSKTGHSPRH